jgi:hypothetical protein
VDEASLRSYFLIRALKSVRSCSDVIRQMTQDEIVRAIQLEEGSLRRESLLKVLYRQSRVLARNQHLANLQEKIHGT